MITPPGTGSVLVMDQIEKSYPGVRALDCVNLRLGAGEVLGLLGENGAGKSTLIKVLGGAVQPDSGTIRINGERIGIASPSAALRAGIGVIYQEFNLVPNLSARENIFLGQERTTAGVIHQRDESETARALFETMGVTIDPNTLCKDLSIAQQQVVEIAKALLLDARILVMDEPSATLTAQEVERLFVVINELKSSGIGIIYISHRLDEVFEIADRVSVLRDGRNVGDRDIRDVNRDGLIEMMVGRKLENEFPARQVAIGETRLDVQGLCRGNVVRNASFVVRRGEVLALTGLVGAGRTEVARLIFGADRRDAGTIELDGRRLAIRKPRDAVRAGICLLTEDRKGQGLVLGHSVCHNFALPNLKQLCGFGVVQRSAERSAFGRYVEDLNIRIATESQTAGQLSGGNQQKLVLAKWLQRNSDVILFDEPTRGIDVGAKYEIYQLINELAAAGKSIVMISSELPEVLGMADRILVMHNGQIVGELTDVANTTQQQIMQLAVG